MKWHQETRKSYLSVVRKVYWTSEKVNPIDSNIYMPIDSTFYHHKCINTLNYKPKTVKKQFYKHNKREVHRMLQLGILQLKFLA